MTRGAAAEALAAQFLQERGLDIIARNYRCRGGEIDLIARDGSTLVFVEPKAARKNCYNAARVTE
jgi:putative endonuclease